MSGSSSTIRTERLADTEPSLKAYLSVSKLLFRFEGGTGSLGELLDREWLGEKADPFQIDRLAELLFRIARDEEDRQIGVALAGRPRRGRPVHRRHDDVRDHQVDVRFPLQYLQRRFAILGDEDGVAVPGERPLGHGADRRLVLD